ncbi:DUF4340 domain-containing protein [bacterium]|nr:DUF4340 domain-containing protein [bacterium]
MKRYFPTLIALVTFGILFLYTNIYEIEPIPKEGEDNPVQLSKVSTSLVKSVSWKTPSNEEIKVLAKSEKDKISFEIVKPSSYHGEESEISGILKNFEDFKSERVISKTATDSSIFGIGTNSPQLSIESASETVTFRLGNDSPVGGSYLIKVGDPAIYLVSGSVVPAFRKSVNDLRSKNLFFQEDNFSTSDVSFVKLEQASGVFEIKKVKSGDWEIVSPKKAKADSTEINSIIERMHDLRITSFVSDQILGSNTYGLDKPQGKIAFESSNGNKFEVLIGREENSQIFLKRADQPFVYGVVRADLTMFDKDFNGLRSKVLPQILSSEIKGLSIKTASESYMVQKNASNSWEIKGRIIDSVKVNDLIGAYNSTKIHSFLPWTEGKSQGIENVIDCDRFELISASETRTLVFGKTEGTYVSAALEGQNEVLKLPSHIRDSFNNLLNLLAKPPEPPKLISSPTANVPEKPKEANQPKVFASPTEVLVPELKEVKEASETPLIDPNESKPQEDVSSPAILVPEPLQASPSQSQTSIATPSIPSEGD